MQKKQTKKNNKKKKKNKEPPPPPQKKQQKTKQQPRKHYFGLFWDHFYYFLGKQSFPEKSRSYQLILILTMYHCHKLVKSN